jgi:hypothetical protein
MKLVIKPGWNGTSPPGSISGTVFGGGSFIEGAVVEAIKGGVVKGSDVTDSDGDYTISSLPPGEYQVRAKAQGYGLETKKGIVVQEGKETSGVNFILTKLPDKILIFTYPNPAKRMDILTFKYYLTEDSDVSIKIYDLNYDEVETIEEDGVAGFNEIHWDITNIASGVYIYVFKVGERRIIGKTTIIK